MKPKALTTSPHGQSGNTNRYSNQWIPAGAELDVKVNLIDGSFRQIAVWENMEQLLETDAAAANRV